MKNSLRTTTFMSLICFLFFSFSNCGSSKSKNEEFGESKAAPFVVSDSYFQNWVAGVQEGGKGTKIYIELESVEEGVKFNTIYFRGKSSEVIKLPNSKLKYMADIRTDKTRPDVVMDSDTKNEGVNTPPIKMPLEIPDTDAALTYTYKGNSRVYVLKDLKEKDMIAYPSSNPKGDN